MIQDQNHAVVYSTVTVEVEVYTESACDAYKFLGKIAEEVSYST